MIIVFSFLIIFLYLNITPFNLDSMHGRIMDSKISMEENGSLNSMAPHPWTTVILPFGQVLRVVIIKPRLY